MFANILTKASPVARTNLILKRNVATPPHYNSAAHLNNMSYAVPVMGGFMLLMGAFYIVSPFHVGPRVENYGNKIEK